MLLKCLPRSLSQLRPFSISTKTSLPSKPYFLTTPIFYVNASPHLGHVYTAVMADAQARFRELTDPKRSSFLSTGTDEHGLKIERAARKNQVEPQEFCDQVSQSYVSAFDPCHIRYSDFVRTTEQRHKECVEKLWVKLRDNGHLKKAPYSSWYCVPDETFLSENQTEVKDGVRVSLESGHPVEWAEEENYVFALSKFQDQVRRYLDSGDVIKPKMFRSQLSGFLDKEELPDLSVSRSSSRLRWGIPVPGDPSQVIYVWLDALANYLTVSDSASQSLWPPEVQLMGKDILKFHAVYWPAFLMAADLEPPKNIFCHSHWMVNGEKMSKSKGNVLDPIQLSDRFSGDGLRYCLLREGVPHADGNFQPEQMVLLLNGELANTLGNLLNRCTAKTVNLNQSVPAFDQVKMDKHATTLTKDLLRKLEKLGGEVGGHYSEFNYYKGLDCIMEVLRDANAFVEEEKPWELKKTDLERLEVVISTVLETLRVCGILLQPIVPELAKKLLDKLKVEERNWNEAENVFKSSNKETAIDPQKVVLFKKVE